MGCVGIHSGMPGHQILEGSEYRRGFQELHVRIRGFQFCHASGYGRDQVCADWTAHRGGVIRHPDGAAAFGAGRRGRRRLSIIPISAPGTIRPYVVARWDKNCLRRAAGRSQHHHPDPRRRYPSDFDACPTQRACSRPAGRPTDAISSPCLSHLAASCFSILPPKSGTRSRR